MTPQGWRSDTLRLTPPLWLVRAMWGRARQWHVDRGGRFDATHACLFIWTGTGPGARAAGSTAVAAVHVLWQQPTLDHATFYQMDWDPTRGGSVDLVWEALDVLAGVSLPRS